MRNGIVSSLGVDGRPGAGSTDMRYRANIIKTANCGVFAETSLVLELEVHWKIIFGSDPLT